MKTLDVSLWPPMISNGPACSNRLLMLMFIRVKLEPPHTMTDSEGDTPEGSAHRRQRAITRIRALADEVYCSRTTTSSGDEADTVCSCCGDALAGLSAALQGRLPALSSAPGTTSDPA